MSTPTPAAKKSWFSRHKILTSIGVLVLLGAIFGGGSNGGSSNSDSTTAASSTTASNNDSTTTSDDSTDTEPAVAPAPKPAKKKPAKPAMTVSQENAVRKASDYLDMTGFSRKGLIKQLKFEGYNLADATYGAEHVGANWNVQAARKGKDYLDMTGFSHSGLVQQLMYDGYTRSQAEYGARKNGL